ncbi:MAG TPA: MopE-related protein [Polyangiaceae bacterium]|nr:MopE-related protein [Polyangiaceae bacterium]
MRTLLHNLAGSGENSTSPRPHCLLAAYAAATLVLSVGCGSRSELGIATGAAGSAGAGGGGPTPSCTVDAECPAVNACGSYRCMAQRCEFEAVSCDDRDPCTEDTCDPGTGCRHRFLSLDMDGDGHRSPRPGFSANNDVCGDDCDDTNPNAFKNNPEACDGIDNDCDGVVDNGFSYLRPQTDAVRVAPPGARRSQRDDGGITATPNAFVIAYTTLADRYESRLKGVSSSGKTLFETQVSDVNPNTYAGSLTWSGQDLATAWSDARQGGEYDLYARLFGPRGEKQKLPTRITDSPGFSLHPTIKWNQSEYLVAFDDRRAESNAFGDHAQIFGQRLAPDGSLLGGNVLLVDEAGSAEYPSLALSPERVGLAYVFTGDNDGQVRLGLRVLDAALKGVGRAAPVGSDVDTLTLQFVQNRFIALWDVSDGSMQGDAIWGAAFDLSGNVVVQPKRVTTGARFARSVSALSLGDRFLMMWGDDAMTATGVYELYFQTLDADLNVLDARRRFTFSNTTSLSPAMSPGPDASIGVVYESWQDGSRQVYFSTLVCAPTK